MIVGLDDVPAEAHYKRGIKDFYQYFRAQYFKTAPRRAVVTVISSSPGDLLEMTKSVYPEVHFSAHGGFLGYFNPADNLIMATGGRTGYGTLLHEMIHALVEADYPGAPSWLNEGLASLYERTHWSGSRLEPLPNWRMDGLREESIPSLSSLTQATRDIGLHSRDNAVVRLFMLFLDRQHLLGDLYRMAKQAGSGFSLQEECNRLALKETDWRSFLENTFREYRAEIALSRGQPSNPDEVRFVQQALNTILGTDLKVDGIST